MGRNNQSWHSPPLQRLEDLFCTVITQLCTPWGSWARFNIAYGGPSAVTVLQKQEANRPFLALINKIFCQRPTCEGQTPRVC